MRASKSFAASSCGQEGNNCGNDWNNFATSTFRVTRCRVSPVTTHICMWSGNTVRTFGTTIPAELSFAKLANAWKCSLRVWNNFCTANTLLALGRIFNNKHLDPFNFGLCTHVSPTLIKNSTSHSLHAITRPKITLVANRVECVEAAPLPFKSTYPIVTMRSIIHVRTNRTFRCKGSTRGRAYIYACMLC